MGETGLPSQLIRDRAVWPLALGRCFGVLVGFLVSWDPMVGWTHRTVISLSLDITLLQPSMAATPNTRTMCNRLHLSCYMRLEGAWQQLRYY